MKPGNVLDAGVGTWKVADFGIAKWIHADETLTGTGELLGSPSYLAPERIAGAQAGPASDLYAVGVLLYEALCGRRPFEGDDPFALADAIREGALRPAGGGGARRRSLDRGVIERAMRLDPADRYEDAEAMAAALARRGRAVAADRTEVRRERPPHAPRPSADGEAASPVPAVDRTALGSPMMPARRPTWATRARHPAPDLIAGRGDPRDDLVVVLSVVVFTGGPGPDAARTTTLPSPLEDALTRLEEAVQP